MGRGSNKAILTTPSSGNHTLDSQSDVDVLGLYLPCERVSLPLALRHFKAISGITNEDLEDLFRFSKYKMDVNNLDAQLHRLQSQYAVCWNLPAMINFSRGVKSMNLVDDMREWWITPPPRRQLSRADVITKSRSFAAADKPRYRDYFQEAFEGVKTLSNLICWNGASTLKDASINSPQGRMELNQLNQHTLEDKIF